ncbi:pro-sigmaK processing inhibitor BofA family protein [Thermaerobacillus caldiproteolyticus]|uniref:Inhibitor of the pro-sigma K processing machinery n=1 Tax=Thermaerobacillus caldiproteolyticus TaxID=247480 RepID=A0A7V9ZA95_9BACL|nr:pro-sigmaK processing inhibitor BofA family protein [Anoxybacillus caldiproteolyticus]MBA2876922.1 inhibitor of the pro-sigma K processing machinery [Anoxybacillus caldiproteolyticus]QPA30975.1 pro-sigmaK processing inhibitor BofA family protein [Anoxybacillus caldiproteolyticus]
MEPKIVIICLLAFIIILLFVGAPLKPLQFIGYGAVKLVIGALLLFVFNAIGSSFSLHIPINLSTSLVSGFLGIPGVAALAVIEKYVL